MPPNRSPAAAPKTDTLIAIGDLKILPDALVALGDISTRTIDSYHRAAFPGLYAAAVEEKKTPRGLIDAATKTMILAAICMMLESAQKAIAAHDDAAPTDPEKIDAWIGTTPDVSHPYVFMSNAVYRMEIDTTDDDLEEIVGIVSPMFGDSDEIVGIISEIIIKFIRLVARNISNTSHTAIRRINVDKMMAIMRNIDRATITGDRVHEPYFKRLAEIKITIKKKPAPRKPKA